MRACVPAKREREREREREASQSTVEQRSQAKRTLQSSLGFDRGPVKADNTLPVESAVDVIVVCGRDGRQLGE
jgi:hypothetical protein